MLKTKSCDDYKGYCIPSVMQSTSDAVSDSSLSIAQSFYEEAVLLHTLSAHFNL